MKNLKLELISDEGIVLRESNLIITEKDKLIMTYDDSIDLENVKIIYDDIKKSLESDSPILTFPEGIKLKVLSIK